MVSISTVIIEKNKRRVHQSLLKFIIATFRYIGYWLNWQVFCSNESSGDQVLRSRTLVSDMNVVMKWKTRVSWNTLFYDSITFWLSAVSEPSPLRLLEISLTYFSYFVLVSDLMMAASKMQISLCFGGQICSTSLHIPSVFWFCVLNLFGLLITHLNGDLFLLCKVLLTYCHWRNAAVQSFAGPAYSESGFSERPLLWTCL